MAHRGYIDSSDQPDGWMAIAFLFLSLLGVRLSGMKLGPVDIVRFAEAFGGKGLRTERPDEKGARCD